MTTLEFDHANQVAAAATARTPADTASWTRRVAGVLVGATLMLGALIAVFALRFAHFMPESAKAPLVDAWRQLW